MVSVIDSGCGLPAGAEQQQVFDPLFTTKESGMGMGLAIARAIVEAHGGTIWTEASPGGGAIFRFSVPVNSGARPAAPGLETIAAELVERADDTTPAGDSLRS
jgi:signal transduction histidine kinase